MNSPVNSPRLKHSREAGKVNNVSPRAALDIVLMGEPPSCHAGISSPAIAWSGGRGCLCANSFLAPGHTHPVWCPLICSPRHFSNSYPMLRVRGRAVVSYQQNHGRFADDGSICVLRLCTVEEERRQQRLAQSTTGTLPTQLEWFEAMSRRLHCLPGLR